MTGRWTLAVMAALTLAGCTASGPAPVIEVAPPSPTAGATVGAELGDQLAADARRVTVTRVIDGDTLAVTGDERIRLLSINASELNSRTKADDAECGAVAARDALAVLLPAGAEVALNGLKGEPDRDRYGRTLSNVYLLRAGSPPLNVSLWLVDQGWARAYVEYRTSETDEALVLEAQARDARRGIWAMCS